MLDDVKKEEPLFEGQVNEMPQFTLVFNGEEYQGVFIDGEVSWYHPQPTSVIGEKELDAIESKLEDLLKKNSD